MNRPPYVLVTVALSAALGGCAAALERSETQDSSAIERAIGLMQSRDLSGAVHVLEDHLNQSPDDAAAWDWLGRMERLRGDRGAARRAFERAVEIDPERWGALYGLAAIRAARGERSEALDLLRRIRDEGRYDLSQIAIDDDLAALRGEPGFEALLPRPEDFADPFVEPARVLHEWRGEAEGDAFGWIARNVGDVDGDGASDFVTSAPDKSVGGARAGRVYVFSSRSGELLWTRSGEPGDRLGLGVERAGDVDADGVPDVLASAPGEGRAYVFSGADGETLLTLEAEQENESFGRHLTGLGDVDGDGRSDLLVGAPGNDRAGEGAGRVALFSGRDGSLLKEWLGDEPGDRLGEAVGGHARNGVVFLLLGAPDAGPLDRGRVDIYTDLGDRPRFRIDSDERGSELGGMFLTVVGDVDADGTLDLYATDWMHGSLGPATGRAVVHSGATGEELFALEGEAAGDGFGTGSGDAGDVDGDGHADLVIGAWQHSGAAPNGGKVYVYSGRDGTLIRAWTCRVMGDTFGFDTTGLGDVDGDGSVDLLVTSAWSAVQGARSGRAFLISSGS